MDSRPTIIPAPETDYANRLLDGADRQRLPGRTWQWIAGLFLLTLIPRLLMAIQLSAACDDAYYYVYVASCLEQKDYVMAFHYLNLNVYPIILLGLHQLGLDWIVAGKIWGLLVTSLTVLPLFGLVRRMFDDRIAAAACFLYAIHPKLIEVGVEPIRDPTFWLFMVTSLYLAWRSIAENRLLLYLASGLLIALAIHTRTEGWILFLPLLAWGAIRMKQAPCGRLKMAAGSVMCLAITPLLLVLVNVTLLHDHPSWEWGRLNQFQICLDWLQKGFGGDAGPPVAAATDSAPAGKAPAPKSAVVPSDHPKAAALAEAISEGRIKPYLHRFWRTMEPVNLVFLFLGVVLWWRTLLLRSDKLVLIVVSAGIMLAIWIRLSEVGDINGRYFVSVYFLMVPYAGMGMLWVLNRLERSRRNNRQSVTLNLLLPGGLALVLSVVFLTDALTNHHRRREAQDKLGHWLKENYGPLDSVAVNMGALRVGYYTVDSQPIISNNFFSPSPFQDPGGRPEMVVLSIRYAPPDYNLHLQKKIDRWKWERIPPESLPEYAAGFVVLVDPLHRPKETGRSQLIPPKTAAQPRKRR